MTSGSCSETLLLLLLATGGRFPLWQRWTPECALSAWTGVFLASEYFPNRTHWDGRCRFDPLSRELSFRVLTLLTSIERHFKLASSDWGREVKTRPFHQSLRCHMMTYLETSSLRPHRGSAFRPSIAVSFSLEDRRLLSALGSSTGVEDLQNLQSSQVVGDSAFVMPVNLSPANVTASGSGSDSTSSTASGVSATANDGESSAAQAQGTAPTSGPGSSTAAPSVHAVSDPGETSVSTSADPSPDALDHNLGFSITVKQCTCHHLGSGRHEPW